MRILITGASGFAGSHLAKRLAAGGHEVVGTTTAGDHPSLLHMDLRDPTSVDDAVRAAVPERVWHLAAQSRAGRSWEDPGSTYEVNVAGTHFLLESLRRRAPESRVLLAGTSDAYGVSASEGPCDESAPLRALSPYAASKVAQEVVGRMFCDSYGLHVIVTRAFYHVGPGQPASFAIADWARQIARAEAGLSRPLVRVGNLELRRDVGDVRDVTRAYELALQHGAPGDVFNVATGRARTLRQVLATLLSLATVDVRVEIDPSRIRPADPPVLEGSYARLEALTGWRPSIALEDTLAEMLEEWRAEARAERSVGITKA